MGAGKARTWFVSYRYLNSATRLPHSEDQKIMLSVFCLSPPSHPIEPPSPNHPHAVKVQPDSPPACSLNGSPSRLAISLSSAFEGITTEHLTTHSSCIPIFFAMACDGKFAACACTRRSTSLPLLMSRSGSERTTGAISRPHSK